MRDYAFYNAGCSGLTGHRKAIIPLRRLIRRLLRPFFYRQAELFAQLGQEVDALKHWQAELARQQAELAAQQRRLAEAEVACLVRRQDDLDRRLRASLAFGWDYVAMVRRLGTLEECVEALMTAGQADAAGQVTRMSIAFARPEGEGAGAEETEAVVERKSAAEA